MRVRQPLIEEVILFVICDYKKNAVMGYALLETNSFNEVMNKCEDLLSD